MSIDMLLGAVGGTCLFASQAMAGPAFAYSWLTTDKSFDRCMGVAKGIMSERNYPHVRTTRFGVTGETVEETLYINCEDSRHVSLVLMLRTGRPGYGDIDAVVALMQKQLNAVGAQ
ncbi:hypothetical protein IHQ71_22715 [Rhizobium sp. TH2]|uniref:hypothetical protein n=1 Tax=Rhizobium sp. TH2 TaxID=2775403 RepID=UPI0021583F0E|nr:hypothetical protein [Rhizobium sp. TH2]UVC07958.1 hypothetical protein IHQ71_22715 [Rhizobium sp. TH2]